MKILRGNTLDFSLKNEEFKKFLIDSTNHYIESYLALKKRKFCKRLLDMKNTQEIFIEF